MSDLTPTEHADADARTRKIIPTDPADADRLLAELLAAHRAPSRPERSRNSLAFWFPPLLAAGLPVPRTHLAMTVPDNLMLLLDGETPDGFAAFIEEMVAAGERVGWPCFIRSGETSGKHGWEQTCFVSGPEAMAPHIAAIVEFSALADLWGLPVDVWAVREMLDTAPLFHCAAYGNMPVVREFRFFIRDDTVEHVQPYWPSAAVAEGRPTASDWRPLLAAASHLSAPERAGLEVLARSAVRALGGGYWSVDLLVDRQGQWWLTDMAEGERSFRWEP